MRMASIVLVGKGREIETLYYIPVEYFGRIISEAMPIIWFMEQLTH